MKKEKPIPNRPLTFNRATFFHVLIASATVYRIVRRNQSAYTKYLGSHSESEGVGEMAIFRQLDLTAIISWVC